MKNSLIYSIILILILSFIVNAQDYKRLKGLSATLNKQANEIVKLTSKDIDKKSGLTDIEIERAFLAQQLLASTKLMRRLINDKYESSELLSAGKVLFELSKNFPSEGSHQNEWEKIKNSIDVINKELQSEKAQVQVQEKPIKEVEVEEVKVNENNLLGKVFWTGTVDAKVHLIIRGSKLTVQTLDGTEYKDGIPSFTAPLPTVGEIAVGAKKIKGRGNIKVIQQPNADNDYTAKIEIVDKNGGAKPYTVEVFWSGK